jgi:hypothetical protein
MDRCLRSSPQIHRGHGGLNWFEIFDPELNSANRGSTGKSSKLRLMLFRRIQFYRKVVPAVLRAQWRVQ